MELTAVQQDALIELLNIGFGRAAASLSQLTGHRVLLEVPQVTIHPVDEVAASLEGVISADVASVHQIFSGPVAGDALLMLDQSGAAMLKELLTNEPALPLSIDASAREVITEVGNILLNACLGTFGNILNVQVTFSVPHLSLESVGAILESLRVHREGVQVRAGDSRRLQAARRRGARLSGHRAQRRVARSADSGGRAVGAQQPVKDTEPRAGDLLAIASRLWFEDLGGSRHRRHRRMPW